VGNIHDAPLAPHLVGDYCNAPPVEFEPSFAPPSAAGLPANERNRDTWPASCRLAEKGEILFRLFSDDLIALIERVIGWDGKSWNADLGVC
jgi:creatinine amidohydrolase